MFENYLLNPAAIAAVASSIDDFRENGSVTVEEVSEWIETNQWEKQFHGKKTVPTAQRSTEFWLENVHGAMLLTALFRDLSGGTVEFHKTEHAVALAEWIVDNAPADLAELAELLNDVLHSPR